MNIIGAGPAGSYTGYQLAKRGHDVIIYEEHKVIGEPFQCTGIVTSKIHDLVDVSDVCVNKINAARIIAGGKAVEIPFSKPNLILDRCAFDQKLANMAYDAGAHILTEHHAVHTGQNQISVKNLKTARTLSRTHDFLVGADGPLSMTAKQNRMWCNRQMWQGVQARAKLSNDNAIEFFPDIGTFAWIVPEDRQTVRIGLLAEKGGKPIFDAFCKKAGVKKIISMQGGLVPKYDPHVVASNGNIRLVGDAALQVKATTGGGIIQGLIASEALAIGIDNNRDYERLWRKKIGRELWLHLKMRNAMDKFTRKDWEDLIRVFQTERNRSILSNHDRDRLLGISLRLSIEARLWKYIRFFF